MRRVSPLLPSPLPKLGDRSTIALVSHNLIIRESAVFIVVLPNRYRYVARLLRVEDVATFRGPVVCLRAHIQTTSAKSHPPNRRIETCNILLLRQRLCAIWCCGSTA